LVAGEGGLVYHEKSPDSVVGEDGAGEDEHCEAYEAVELVGFVWLVFCDYWLIRWGGSYWVAGAHIWSEFICLVGGVYQGQLFGFE
jgi:hypothetical protein